MKRTFALAILAATAVVSTQDATADLPCKTSVLYASQSTDLVANADDALVPNAHHDALQVHVMLGTQCSCLVVRKVPHKGTAIKLRTPLGAQGWTDEKATTSRDERVFFRLESSNAIGYLVGGIHPPGLSLPVQYFSGGSLKSVTVAKGDDKTTEIQTAKIKDIAITPEPRRPGPGELDLYAGRHSPAPRMTFTFRDNQKPIVGNTGFVERDVVAIATDAVFIPLPVVNSTGPAPATVETLRGGNAVSLAGLMTHKLVQVTKPAD